MHHNQAISIIIAALDKAAKSGVYGIEEAGNIALAIQSIITEQPATEVGDNAH